MYEVFERLLKENGLKAADVSRATGINSTFFSEWKRGKFKKPGIDKIKKLSDFFGVSTDYFTLDEETELEKYGEEMSHLYAKIRNDSKLSSVLLKYFELSEQKKSHVIELIQLLSE